MSVYILTVILITIAWIFVYNIFSPVSGKIMIFLNKDFLKGNMRYNKHLTAMGAPNFNVINAFFKNMLLYF